MSHAAMSVFPILCAILTEGRATALRSGQKNIEGDRFAIVFPKKDVHSK
jgi:hypothetical protein